MSLLYFFSVTEGKRLTAGVTKEKFQGTIHGSADKSNGWHLYKN